MISNKKVNKTGLKLLAFALIFLLVPFSSCKKRKAFNEENGQEATDVATFRAEGDAAMEDINNIISNQFLLRGKLTYNTEALSNVPCGMDLDTTELTTINSKGIIRLNYNGSTCNSRSRNGTIMVTVLDYPFKKWKQKGCTLKIDFLNFKVTGLKDGRAMRVNGTAYLNNESGATWYDMKFLNVGTVIHHLSGSDIKLTFDESGIVVLNISRRYTYSISGGVISCRVEGTGSKDGNTSLESWGINRLGNEFTSAITSPLVWKTSCGGHSPIEGEVKVNVVDKYFELTSTYGVDASGNPESGNTCPYGWKINWTYKNKTNKRIFSYSR
ncbi:MAG: hypothetical protein IT236_09040 [Bacteroidia bacterium]|nr:hypothetical protein [Bacteroidia bacterium]